MSSTTSHRCPFADQFWYAGAISERKCEETLVKTGTPGAFLVRDYLLPGAQYNYILSLYSGNEILHYDVMVFPTEECDLNGYSFTSLPEAIEFYTDNRLQGHYLSPPKQPVVTEITRKGMVPVTMATQPAPPPRLTSLQPQQQFCDSALPSSVSLEEGVGSGTWSPASGDTSCGSYSPPLTIPNNNGSPDNAQDVPNSAPDSTNNEHDNKASLEPCPRQFNNVIKLSTFYSGPIRQEDSGSNRKEIPRSSPSPRSPPSPLSPPSQPQSPPSNPMPVTRDEHTETKADEKEKKEPTPLRKEHMKEKGKSQKAPPPPPPTRVSSVVRITTNESTNEEEIPKSPTSPTQSPTVPLTVHEETDSPSDHNRQEEGRLASQLELSLEERRKKIEAQMADAASPSQSPSHLEKTPGRLVINEALANVSVAMPTTVNPLLLKKQEEAATAAAVREREKREKEEKEREERERLAREQKEKEEKERKSKRFSFRRSSSKGKKEEKEAKKEEKEVKEENRRSMSISERDEFQNVFKHVVKSRETSPDPDTPSTPSSDPDPSSIPSPLPPPTSERGESHQNPGEGGQGSKLPITKGLAAHPEIPEEDHTHCHTPPPIQTRPKSSGSSSRSNTLDRNSNPPPSTSPPSLPGSIDRRTWPKPSTLERVRPGSGPGSRQGTLERKTPPPPTCQPPPVPADARRDTPTKLRSNTAFSGGRMELADLILGVSRQTLTGQAPPTPPPPSSSSFSSEAPCRRNTISSSSSSAAATSGPINMKRPGKDKRTSLRKGHL